MRLSVVLFWVSLVSYFEVRVKLIRANESNRGIAAIYHSLRLCFLSPVLLLSELVSQTKRSGIRLAFSLLTGEF